jgi:hypothetical protein
VSQQPISLSPIAAITAIHRLLATIVIITICHGILNMPTHRPPIRVAAATTTVENVLVATPCQNDSSRNHLNGYRHNRGRRSRSVIGILKHRSAVYLAEPTTGIGAHRSHIDRIGFGVKEHPNLCGSVTGALPARNA